MEDLFRAAKRFAYSDDGLDRTDRAARGFAWSWVENRCEGSDHIKMLQQNFRREYDFAYSGSGLNMTSSAAVKYAADKVSRLTRCGLLLR